MAQLQRNPCNLFYVDEGEGGAPLVLLLHGLGCQLVEWPDSLVQALIAAGFRVVRMDNRDIGLSGRFAAPAPDPADLFARYGAGEPVAAPYSLADVAEDVAALLDHLDARQAHCVGLSMGGMIAQRLAIQHPASIHSLTSIMSTPGLAHAPPTPEAGAALVALPAGDRFEDLLVQRRQMWELIGGPHYSSAQHGLARLASAALRRSYSPDGFARQLAAILADEDRAPALAAVRVPTLVIHGDADPLVPLAGGQATAAAVPGASCKIFKGMGHDLPEPLSPEIAAAIINHISTA